jgi:hypothetical protein
MPYNTLPIVGMHFRPPAKVLVNALSIGVPLFLLAEPSNAFDEHAIQVFLESKNIPEAAHGFLDEGLPQFGFDLDTVLGQEQWHLGYIPKEFAKLLKESGTVVNDKPMDVTFATNAQGAPRVRFAEPVL